MMNNGLYNQTNMPAVGDPMAAPMPNQMVQNEINPKAFGAPATIAGVYGQANPGTFTRSIGPLTPPVDPASITPTPNFNNI
jgi:hypothetical protein